MRYRAFRSEFCQTEFDHHEGMFWAMPANWGTPGAGVETVLRRVREDGGVGAVALLPIIGRYAHWERADAVMLSIEQCARLGGCDQDSIRRGVRTLAAHGFAATKTKHRYGKTVTTRNIAPRISAPMTDGRLDAATFRFDSRVVYGGAWAMLTGTQKALYLGAATKAYTFRDIAGIMELLDGVLDAGADRSDIDSALRWAGMLEDRVDAVSGPRAIRFAEASVAELAAITGVSETGLHTAMNSLKRHPENPGTPLSRYAPLAVIPARAGRPNLFLFRDHAEHWPWEVLNGRVGRSRSA